MKKVSIVFIVVLLFIGSVSAQGFGLKGGVNLGKFVGEDTDELSGFFGIEFDEKYNFGYGGGIFLALPIDPLDIRIEALYQQNGGKYKFEEQGVEGSYTIQLNWIDVPILFGAKLGPVRVFAGPYFDYFLGGKYKFEVTEGNQSEDEEEDIEADDLRSINYGIIGGIAYGMGSMELEVRYSQGLVTLDEEPDDWDASFGKYEETDFKPSMIQAFLNFYLSN